MQPFPEGAPLLHQANFYVLGIQWQQPDIVPTFRELTSSDKRMTKIQINNSLKRMKLSKWANPLDITMYSA